jgi:hypothetical protein
VRFALRRGAPGRPTCFAGPRGRGWDSSADRTYACALGSVPATGLLDTGGRHHRCFGLTRHGRPVLRVPADSLRESVRVAG